MVDPKNKIYEIKLKGHLNESWAAWFGEMSFTHENDGTTTLTGEIVDQSALHGALAGRIRPFAEVTPSCL